jgi:hypothetical protein
MRNGSRAQRGDIMMNGHDDDISPRELAAICREYDRFRTEQHALAEHQALTRRVDAETGLAYRDQEQPAPEPEPDWSGWEAWRAAHQSILKTEILDWVLDSVPAFVCTYVGKKLEERDRKIADLEAELVECKGMLGRAIDAVDDARSAAAAEAEKQHAAIERLERQELVRRTRDATITERSNRIGELMRSNAESRAELARQQFEQAFAARDARLHTMEEKFEMLLRYMSLAGLELPRF